MSKIIISDTSCLIVLQRANLLHILKNLFGEVYITDEVRIEYGDELPDWIIIRKLQNSEKLHDLESKLDPGEASAIAMALEVNDSVLIIDEYKGRKIAESLNLNFIGTLGIILMAHKRDIFRICQELCFSWSIWVLDCPRIL